MTSPRVMLALALLVGALVPLGGQSPEADLQRAIQREVVFGDLDAAVAEYLAIAIRAESTNRAAAAQALLRAAEVQAKRGDPQARALYERVASQFRDQADAAALARAQLNPGDRRDSVSRLVWTPPEDAVVAGKLSPDGRHLPYHQETVMMLRDLATGASRELTRQRPDTPVQERGYAEGSAFSRDGRELAYAWRVRAKGIYQLRVLPLTGNSSPVPRVLVDDSEVAWLAPYDWTPDGRSIAVLVQRRDQSGAIGVVSTATGAFQSLRSVAWGSVSNAAFSPNGAYLAFDAGETERSRDVFVLAGDGSRGDVVVSFPADDTLVGWTPDGNSVLFLSDRDGSVDLWSQRLRDGRAVGDPMKLRSNVPRFWPLGVTPDGTIHGASATTSGSRLRVGSNELVGAPGAGLRVVDDFVGPVTPLAWSHDDKWLAYASQWLGIRPRTPLFESAHAAKIVVRDASTGEARTLQTEIEYVNDLDWAWDDQSLVIAGGTRSGRAGLFRVDVLNGRTTTLVAAPDEQVTLVPRLGGVRDSRVYFARNVIATQTARLVEYDMDSGRETDVLPFAPRFMDAPAHDQPVRTILGVTDRRQVLYTTVDRATGRCTLAWHSIDGASPRELLRAQGPDMFTLVDGTDESAAIVGRTRSSSNDAELYRVPLDGKGDAVRIATTPDLSSFRLLGPSSDDAVYLGKRRQSDGLTEIWRLTMDGAVRPTGEAVDIIGSLRPPFTPSRNSQRVAFVGAPRGPVAGLEVWAFENVVPR